MSQPQLFGVPQQDWEVGPATPSIGLIRGSTLDIVTSDALHVRNSVKGKPDARQVLAKPLDAHLGLIILSRGSVMRIVPASMLRQLPDLDELLNLKPGYKTLFLAPLECHVLHTTLRCILDHTKASANSARLPLRFLSACETTLRAVNAALAAHEQRGTTHRASGAPSAVGPQQLFTPAEVLPVQVHAMSASMAAWCTSVLIGQSPSLLQSGLMSMAHQVPTWPGHIWDQGKFTKPWTRAATWRFPRRSQLTPAAAAGGGLKANLSSLAQVLLLTTHRTALQALTDAQQLAQRPSAAANGGGGAASTAAATPWGGSDVLGEGGDETTPDSKSKSDGNSGKSGSDDARNSCAASFAGVDSSKMSLAVAITGAAVAGFACTNMDHKVRHCVSNVMLAHSNLLALMAGGTSPLGIMALLTGEAASWPKAARNLGDVPARNALAALYTPIHTPWNPLHNLRPDAGHGVDAGASTEAGDTIVDIVSPCDMLQTCTLPTYSPSGLAAGPGSSAIAHGTPVNTEEFAKLSEALMVDKHERQSGVLRGVPLFATVYSRGSIDVWSRGGVFPVCHAFALQALRPHLYGVQVAAGTPAAALHAWMQSGNASLGPVAIVPPSCVQATASGPPPGVDETEGDAAPAVDEVLESSLAVGAQFELDVGDSAIKARSIAGAVAAGLSPPSGTPEGGSAVTGVHCATAKLHPSMAGLDSVPAPAATVQNSGSSEAVQWCCAGLSVVISKGPLTNRIGWVTGVADKKNEQLFVRVLPPLALPEAETAGASTQGGEAAGDAKADEEQAAASEAAAASDTAGETGTSDANAESGPSKDAAVAEDSDATPAAATPAAVADAAEAELDLSDLLPAQMVDGTESDAAPAVTEAATPGDWQRPDLGSFTTVVPVSSLKPHRPGPSSFARLIKGEHKNARVLVLDAAHGPERQMLCADVATGALFTQRKDRVAAERSLDEVLAAEQRIRDVWRTAESAKAAASTLADMAGNTSSSKPIPLYAPVDLPAHDMEQLVGMFSAKRAATGLGDRGQVANPAAGRDARLLTVVHHGQGTQQSAVLCLYHRQEVSTHDDATLVTPLHPSGALPGGAEELPSDVAQAEMARSRGWVTRMRQAVTLRGGRVTHVRYEATRRCLVAAWEGAAPAAAAAAAGAGAGGDDASTALPQYGLLSLPLSSANGEVLASGSACVALPAPVRAIVGVAPWAGCRLGLGLLLALLSDGSVAVCSRGAQVLLHIVPAGQVQALTRTAAGWGASAPVQAVSLLDDRASPVAAVHGLVGEGGHQGSPVLAVLSGDSVGLLSVQSLAEFPRLQAAVSTAALLPSWLSALSGAAGDAPALAAQLAKLSPAQWRSVTAALAPQAGPCKPALTCSAVFGAAGANGRAAPQLGYEDAEVCSVHRIDGSQEIVFRADCAKHSSPIPAAGAVEKEHPALACSEWVPARSFTAGLRLPALTSMHRLFVRACVALSVRATDEPCSALATALERDCLHFGGKHAYSPQGGYLLVQLAGRSQTQAAKDEYSDIFSSLGAQVSPLGGASTGALTLTPPPPPSAALMDLSDDLGAMCSQSEQPVATLLAAQSRGVPLALPENFPRHREYSKVFSDSDNAMMPTTTNDPAKGWTLEAWVCPDEGTFAALPEGWNPSAERLNPRNDVCSAALHIQPIVDLGESQGVGVAFPLAPGFSSLSRKQAHGMLWRRIGALPDSDAAAAKADEDADATPVSKWHAVEWGTAVYRRQTDQLPPAFLPTEAGVYEIALMPKPAFASNETQSISKSTVDAAFDAAVCSGVFASVANASLPQDVALGLGALQQDLPRSRAHSLRTVLETTTGDGSVISVAVSTAGHVHVVCQHAFMHSALRYGGEATGDGAVRVPFVPATNGAGASVAALASNLPGENTVTRPSLTSARDPSWHGPQALEADPPAYDVFAPRIPKGRWSHVALRLHASTAELSLMVNGRLYSRRCRPNLACLEGDFDPTPGSGLPEAARHAPTLLRIGGSVLGDTFHGRVANVRVWGTHTPSRQVQRTMHAPLAPTAPKAGDDCELEYLGLRWAHSLAGTDASAQYGLSSPPVWAWPAHSVFAKGKQEHPDLAKALGVGAVRAASACTGPPVDLLGAGLGDAVGVSVSAETSPGQGYLTDAPLQSAVHTSATMPLQALGLTHTVPLLNSVARTLRVNVQLVLGSQLDGVQAQLVACHVGATGVEVHSAARHMVEAGTRALDVPRAFAVASSHVQQLCAKPEALAVAAWNTALACSAANRTTTSSALRLLQALQQSLLDDAGIASALAPRVPDGAAWALAVRALLQEAPTNEDATLGCGVLLGILRCHNTDDGVLERVATAALDVWKACAEDGDVTVVPAALRGACALIAWCCKVQPALQSRVSSAALDVLLETLQRPEVSTPPLQSLSNTLCELFPASAASIRRMLLPQWAHLHLHSRPLLVHPHAAVASVPRFGSYEQNKVQGAILGAQLTPDMQACVAHPDTQPSSTVDELALLKGDALKPVAELFKLGDSPGEVSWEGTAAALEAASAGTVRISCSQLELKQSAQTFVFDLDAQSCVESDLPSSRLAVPPAMLTGFTLDIVRPESTSSGTIVVSIDAIPAAAAHHTAMQRRTHASQGPRMASHNRDNLLSKWLPTHTLGFATAAQWANAMNSVSQQSEGLSKRAAIDPLARVLKIRASTFALLSRPVPTQGLFRYVFFASEAGASSSFNNLLFALCDKNALDDAGLSFGSVAWKERAGFSTAKDALLSNCIVITPGTGSITVPAAFASNKAVATVVPTSADAGSSASDAPEGTPAEGAAADGNAPTESTAIGGDTEGAANDAAAGADASKATAPPAPKAGYTEHKLAPQALQTGKGQFIALFVDYDAGSVHMDVNSTGLFTLEAAQKLPVKLDRNGPPLHPAVGIDKWSSIGSTSSISVQLHDVAALPSPHTQDAPAAAPFADVSLSSPDSIRIANIAAGPMQGTLRTTAVCDPSAVAAPTDGLAQGVSPVSIAPCSSLYEAVAAASGLGGVHMHVPHAHASDVIDGVAAPATPNTPTRVSLRGLGSLAAGVGARYVEVSIMLVSGSGASDTASMWNADIPNVPASNVDVALSLFGRRIPRALRAASAVDALPDWAASSCLLSVPGRQHRSSAPAGAITEQQLQAATKMLNGACSALQSNVEKHTSGAIEAAQTALCTLDAAARRSTTLDPPPAGVECGRIMRELWRHVHEAQPAVLEALSYASAARAAVAAEPQLHALGQELNKAINRANALLGHSRVTTMQRVAAATLVQCPSGSMPALTKPVVLSTVAALLQQDASGARDAKLFDALASNMLTAYLADSTASGSIVYSLLTQLSAVEADTAGTDDVALMSANVAASIDKGFTLLQRCAMVEAQHAPGGAAAQLRDALTGRGLVNGDEADTVPSLLLLLLLPAPRGGSSPAENAAPIALLTHTAQSNTAARLLSAVLQPVSITAEQTSFALVEACVDLFLPVWLDSAEAGFAAHAACIESVFRLVLRKLSLSPKEVVRALARGSSPGRIASTDSFQSLLGAAVSSASHAQSAKALLESILQADLTTLADCTRLLAERHLNTSPAGASGRSAQRALSIMDTCVTLYECAAGSIDAAAVQNRMLEPPSVVPPALMRSGSSRGSEADAGPRDSAEQGSEEAVPPPPAPPAATSLQRSATAPVYGAARSQAKDEALVSVAPHTSAVRAAVALMASHPLPSSRTSRAEDSDATTLNVWLTALKVLSAHKNATSGRMDALEATDAAELVCFLVQQTLGAPVALRGALSTQARALVPALVRAAGTSVVESRAQFASALQCANIAANALVAATADAEAMQLAARTQRPSCDTKSNTYGASNTSVIVRSMPLKTQAVEATSRAACALAFLQNLQAPLADASVGVSTAATDIAALAQTLLQAAMGHLDWRLRQLDWSDDESISDMQLSDATMQAVNSMLQVATKLVLSSRDAPAVIAHLSQWLVGSGSGTAGTPLFCFIAWAVTHVAAGSCAPFADGCSWQDVLAGKSAPQVLTTPNTEGISGALLQFGPVSAALTVSVQSSILHLLCLLTEKASDQTIAEALVATCQRIVRCAQKRPESVPPPADSEQGSLASMLAASGAAAQGAAATGGAISPLGLHATLQQLHSAHTAAGGSSAGGFMPVLMLLLVVAMQRSTEMASTTLSAVMQVLGADNGNAPNASSPPGDCSSSRSSDEPAAAKQAELAPTAASIAGAFHAVSPASDSLALLLPGSAVPIRLNKNTSDALQLQRIVDNLLQAVAAAPVSAAQLPQASGPLSSFKDKDLKDLVLPLGVPSSTSAKAWHKSVFPGVLRMQDDANAPVKQWSMQGSPVHALATNTRDTFKPDEMTFAYLKASLDATGLGTVAAGGDARYFTFFVALQQPCTVSRIELSFSDARDVAPPLSVMLHAGMRATELAPVAHATCVNVPAATPSIVGAYNSKRHSESIKDTAVFNKHLNVPSASQFALLRVPGAAPAQVLMFTCVLSESGFPRRAGDLFGSLKHLHIEGVPVDPEATSSAASGVAEPSVVLSADGTALNAGAKLARDVQSDALSRTVVEPFMDFLSEHMSAAPFLLQCSDASALSLPADKRLAEEMHSRRTAVRAALSQLTPAAAAQAACSIWNNMKRIAQAHVRSDSDNAKVVEITGSAEVRRAVALLGNLGWHQASVREALLQQLLAWLQSAESGHTNANVVHLRAVLASASVQLLPFLLAAHAADTEQPQQQWAHLAPLLAQLTVVMDIAADAAAACMQFPDPVLCALPLLEALSQVLGGGDEAVIASVPTEPLAGLVSAANKALSKCAMGSQTYKTLLTFVCVGFPHCRAHLSLATEAAKWMQTAATEGQNAMHKATSRHLVYNTIVRECQFEGAGSAAAAVLHGGAALTSQPGLPSVHLPTLAHLIAHVGIVVTGPDAFRMVQGAVQVLQWAACAPDGDRPPLEWAVPKPAMDTSKDAGEAESKDYDRSVCVVRTPLTELCSALAEGSWQPQELCLSVVAFAAHIVSVASDDSTVAQWAGSQLVKPILMCVATSSNVPKAGGVACSVVSAVAGCLRPLRGVLETLIASHKSNKQQAVSTANDAVAGATSLSPSLLALFRLLSGSTSQSYLSVLPPASAGLLTPAVLTLIQDADRAALADKNRVDTPQGESGVPPPMWESTPGLTPIQQVLGLLPDAAGNAAAAAVVAAAKTVFTTDLVSYTDRVEVSDTDPRCVEHTGSSNANALLDLPIVKNSGVFHLTFRLDALKGDSTPGASHAGLCVSFGVSPIKSPDNKALACASMQYMVDQKDANCYDGSVDVGDFREPAPFLSVGDEITIVIDSNAQTFGFFGSNGALNTAFTDIYARIKDAKFSQALYPAVFFYSAQSGRVTLTNVKLVQPPADIANDSVDKWTAQYGIGSVDDAAAALGGAASSPGAAAGAVPPLRPSLRAPVASPATLQGLDSAVAPHNLIVGAATAATDNAAGSAAPDFFSPAQWRVLVPGSTPCAAWRSPVPLVPSPPGTTLEEVAVALRASSRFVRWQLGALLPSVAQADTPLPAAGAGGGDANMVAAAALQMHRVARVGGVPPTTTVGAALKGLAAVKHARTADAAAQLSTPLPEAVAAALAAVTAGDAEAAPARVLTLSFAMSGDPAPLATPASTTAAAGGAENGTQSEAQDAGAAESKTADGTDISDSAPSASSDGADGGPTDALRAAVAAAVADEKASSTEQSMLSWLNEAGILAKLLALIRDDVPRAFGVHPALLKEGGDPEKDPPLLDGTFQHDAAEFESDRGDSWKSVKEVWLEHGASLHSWLRDALALLGHPGTGAVVAQDSAMQGMLQLLLDAYGKLSSVPADVFRGFNMPAKRGGDAHWTGLAAQLVSGVQVKGFLRPKQDPTRTEKLNTALVAAGLGAATEGSSQAGTASKKTAAATGAVTLENGKQVAPTQPGGDVVHPEHGTITLHCGDSASKAVASLTRGAAGASEAGAGGVVLDANDTAHPAAALLAPVLRRVFGAERAEELLSEGNTAAAAAVPAKTASGGKKTAAGAKHESTPTAGSGGAGGATPPAADDASAPATDKPHAAASSLVASIAAAPSLLAALLQRVGESQGFTAADEDTQLQLGDAITTAQKRAKALAAAKKEAQRKAEQAAESGSPSKNTAGGAASTGNSASGKGGDKEYWTAGTGYSYDGQKGLRDFDAAALETKRHQRQAATAAVLALLEAVIRADAADSTTGGPSSQALLKCIANSPVLAVLASFLRSTELDITKQAKVHSAVYAVCHALAEHGTLRSLLVPTDGSSSNSLASLLEEADGIAADVLEPAEGGEGGAKSLDPPAKAAMLALQAAAKAAATAAAAVVAERAAAAAAEGSGADASGGGGAAAAAEGGDASAEHGLQALKDKYVGTMKKLAFGKEDMTKSGSLTAFKYRSSLDSEGKAPAARVTATKQQLRALKSSMPLDYDATVFLRHDKRRPYVIEFMIAAPPDTPYDSGLFLFHMYCDPAFPKQSPKVNLQTTGGGSVRFNPNLYASGKVCLSLLGTWHGGNSREAWTPDSTLLQVLVSILALIFVKYPYYNEPGVEKEQGTERGLRNQRIAENGGYERLRVGTVQWAMVDVLRNPPKGFEDVVKQHFLLKRPHILETCEQWLQEAADDGTAGQHAKLKKQVDDLKAELHKLGDGPAEALLKPAPTPEEKAAAEAADASKAKEEAAAAAAAGAAAAGGASDAAAPAPAEAAAAPAPALSAEAESLKMICPQYPDGMYTYALAQNKDVEAAALWLVEKGDDYFTANAEKFLS